MPVHGGGFRLTGEFDHFLHGIAVSGDHDGFDIDAFAAEEIGDVVAPRAAGFDIEDGKVHGEVVSVVSTGDQEAGFGKFGYFRGGGMGIGKRACGCFVLGSLEFPD